MPLHFLFVFYLYFISSVFLLFCFPFYLFYHFVSAVIWATLFHFRYNYQTKKKCSLVECLCWTKCLIGFLIRAFEWRLLSDFVEVFRGLNAFSKGNCSLSYKSFWMVLKDLQGIEVSKHKQRVEADFIL